MMIKICAWVWLLGSAVGLYAQQAPYSRDDLQRMIQNANGRDEVKLRAELAMSYLSERVVTVEQRFEGEVVGYHKTVQAPELDKARAEIQTLQQLATQIAYPDGQAVAYYLEGMYHITARDTLQAMRALNQWFALRTQQGDPNKARWAYFGKYEYELKLGQKEAARQSLQAILTYLQAEANDQPEELLRDGVARVASVQSLYDLTQDERLMYDLLVPELEKLTLFVMEHPHFVAGSDPLSRLDYFFGTAIQEAIAHNDLDRADALGHQWLASVDRLSASDAVYYRARRIAAWLGEAGAQAAAYNFLTVSIDQAKRTQNLDLIRQAYYNNVYYARQYGDMARGLKTLQALYPFTTFDFKFRSALNACMASYLRSSDATARLAVRRFVEDWRTALDPLRDSALILWCNDQLRLLGQ